MKSYKILIVVVVALVVVNCALLAVIWLGQSKGPGNDGPPKAANEYLIKELSLTPGQQKKYEVMRKDHFERTQKLNRLSRGLRDEFFEHIKSDQLDTAAANAAEAKILANQMTLDTITLNHFRQFRAILSPKQQDKFDQIIQNALRMMGGPPRHGPQGMPPRDGQGPPPDGQGPPPDGQGPPPEGGLPPPPPGS